MKTLRAFTIVELAVSMLIGSIVIGIGYYAVLLFGQQFNAYQRKSEVIGEYFLLKKAIQADFEKADIIRDSSDLFLVLLVNDPGKRVTYKFDGNVIVRNIDEMADTFRIRCNTFKVVHESDHLRLVNELYFEIKLDNSIWGCGIRKRYSALQYMAAEKILYE